MVVDEAVPLSGWVEYHRWVKLEPLSGLGVTDHADPVSTDTPFGVVVSVNDFLAPLRM